MWVRVQLAYAENDIFELRRLEEHLLSSKEVPSLAYSSLLAQADHLSEKIEKLRKEIILLRSEKAWNFSQQKNIRSVEQELESEFQSTLKNLRQKQSYFSKTFDSWQVQDSKPRLKRKFQSEAPSNRLRFLMNDSY